MALKELSQLSGAPLGMVPADIWPHVLVREFWDGATVEDAVRQADLAVEALAKWRQEKSKR